MKIGALGWIALGVTGTAALLAWSAPMLVVIGFFLFIIPGLLLMLAPTVFVYLAATLACRELIPISSRWASTGIAFVIVLGASWLVMQPFRSAELAKYNAQVKPSVKPEQPLVLSGHVRVEIENYRVQPHCDYLCAAILSQPGVNSVTLVNNGRQPFETAFALVSAESHPGPGLVPVEPGEWFQHSQLTTNHDDRIAKTKALEAHWALRLAADQRLVVQQPISREDADWIVRRQRLGTWDTLRSERVEIVDAGGNVRFRDGNLRHRIPGRFLYFGFDTKGGAGTVSDAYFHLGGQVLYDGERYFESEPALLTGLNLPLQNLDAQLPNRLRAAVQNALDDPQATSAQLELARHWLSSFQYDAAQVDFPLIAKILTDDRISDLQGPMSEVVFRKNLPSSLSVPIARRILMDQTTEKERGFFARMLANMPEGTFAQPDEAHVAVWTNPEICQHVIAFLRRIDDQEPERAAASLLSCLEATLEIESKYDRRPVLEALQEEFAELGPDGASAITRLTELIQTRGEMYFQQNTWGNKWRFVLVRMGVELEDLPLSPFEEKQSATWIKNIQDQMRKRVQRYERK